MTVGGGEDRLRALAAELRSGRPNSVAQRWREAVRASMAFKKQRYQRELQLLQAEIDDAQRKVTSFVKAARAGPTPLADDKTSNWEVAEKVTSRWQTLVTQSAALERIIESAQLRHDLINNASDFAPLRNELDARGPDRLAEVTDHVASRLRSRFGAVDLEGAMAAFVITAAGSTAE